MPRAHGLDCVGQRRARIHGGRGVDELKRGVKPEAMYERLKAELPDLEEQVAGEEACYTFDWYDDHHYEKIYSGRLMACRALLELYEKSC